MHRARQAFHSGKQDFRQASLGVDVENDVLAHLPRMQVREVIRLTFARALNAHISLGNQCADGRPRHRSRASEKSRAWCHPPDTVTWDTPLTPVGPIFPTFARRAEP